MTKPLHRPTDAITVKTYEALGQFIEAFGAGHLNLVILVGGPGLAKSQLVRQALGGRACWIEGNATAFGVYSKLWKHQNKPVVIDDVDGLYSDKSAVRLLKCLCQTDPQKQIAWHSAAASVDKEGMPREFATTSRVVIIANDWKNLNVNAAAVQDRGHLLLFEPTFEEVHRQVAKWFWDQEVFQWFGAHGHLITEPSMRHYVRAAELKQAGIDWLQVMMGDVLSEKALLVAKLKADLSFHSEEDRAKAFQASGGGCRATYFNYARKLRKGASKAPLNVSLQNPSGRPTLRAA